MTGCSARSRDSGFQPPTWWLRAYGLQIRSEVPFPGLPSEPCRRVNVVVRRSQAKRNAPVQSGATVSMGPDCVTLSWGGTGALEIRGGRELVFLVRRETDLSHLRGFLFGAAMGVLLHQRGLLVLHASAAVLAGRAVAFLGHPRAGKSTLAALLSRKGYPVLTDDVLPLRTSAGRARALAGPAALRLWPESLKLLDEDYRKLVPVRVGVEKRTYPVDNDRGRRTVQLGAVYVLGRGSPLRIERLAGHEAVVELVRHSYCARLVSTDDAASHLRACASVVKQVPLTRLQVPDRLTALHAIAEFVEADCTARGRQDRLPHAYS